MNPRWWGCVVMGLLWSACPPTPLPGDEDLGSFGLHAEPTARDCTLEEVSAGSFDFDVRFSRQADASVAWATLGGVSRDASWDGQVMTSTAWAPRVFQQCAGCITVMAERLDVALLSNSQAAVLAGTCPESALDGGVPVRDDDAGIRTPNTTKDGFDAVLACGELSTWLESSDADAGTCPEACLTCTRRYRLTGSRR